MPERQAEASSSVRISKRQRAALGATAVATFYTATLSLGYYHGKRQSIDWNDSVAIQKFINSNHTVKYVRANAGNTGQENDPIELTLRIGDRQYRYKSSSDKVSYDILSPEEIAKLATPRQQGAPDEEKMIFAVGSIVTPSYASLMNSRRLIRWISHLHGKQFVAVAIPAAVLGAGAAWGYSMGYKPLPDYSSDSFQNAIQDPKRWRPLVQHYRLQKPGSGR